MTKKSKRGMLFPPAIGYSMTVVLSLIIKNKLSLKYFLRIVILVMINIINYPFRTYERLFINPRFKHKDLSKAPVFIIGHWRSGTTHLHNLLCQDSQMAYASTYQSVFPDTLFNKLGRFLFKGFSSLLIPGTRKGDNVSLGSSLPQEEEFALGAKTPLSFYFFWMFPQKMIQFYDTYIRFHRVKKKQLDRWKSDYHLFIKKAIKNTTGDRYLSKNPPNTGRIKTLLSMFPDAKFIFIHRNPVEVFLSTQNFYRKMLPPLQLQAIHTDQIDTNIISIYKKIMNDYLLEKEAIPAKNLVEVPYTELEKSPLVVLETIYTHLDLDNFEAAFPRFEHYIDKMKSYNKNKHHIEKHQLETIRNEWRFFMDAYAYDVPENVIVI